MDDLIYTASSESGAFDPIEVRVVGVRQVSITEKPQIEIYLNGERIELERPGTLSLANVPKSKHSTETVPVLRVTSSYVEQLFGLDHEEVYMKLDREWKDEFKKYAEAHRRERFAAAHDWIERYPETPVTVSRSYGMGTYYHAHGDHLDESVREYLNHLLDAIDGEGVGVELEYEYEGPDDRGGNAHVTVGEVIRLARSRQERRQRAEQKEKEKRQAAFRKARETGRPVELSRWGTMSHDLPRRFGQRHRDEGDYCFVVTLAMPDGSTKETVEHSY